MVGKVTSEVVETTDESSFGEEQVADEALYEAIVKKLRMMGKAGATVYCGILGYGAKNRLYKSGPFGFSEDLPVMISVIDTEEKIRRALPVLQKMIGEGLVTMADVEVLHHISDT